MAHLQKPTLKYELGLHEPPHGVGGLETVIAAGSRARRGCRELLGRG